MVKFALDQRLTQLRGCEGPVVSDGRDPVPSYPRPLGPGRFWNSKFRRPILSDSSLPAASAPDSAVEEGLFRVRKDSRSQQGSSVALRGIESSLLASCGLASLSDSLLSLLKNLIFVSEGDGPPRFRDDVSEGQVVQCFRALNQTSKASIEASTDAFLRTHLARRDLLLAATTSPEIKEAADSLRLSPLVSSGSALFGLATEEVRQAVRHREDQDQAKEMNRSLMKSAELAFKAIPRQNYRGCGRGGSSSRGRHRNRSRSHSDQKKSDQGNQSASNPPTSSKRGGRGRGRGKRNF